MAVHTSELQVENEKVLPELFDILTQLSNRENKKTYYISRLLQTLSIYNYHDIHLHI